MRHISLLACAALFALPMSGQVVFQSGFEDWTDGLPDDFMGVRTHPGFTDSVSQVTSDPHSGNFAVRLQNRATLTGDHRRFTTQPVEVEANETYTVTFWARGYGDVRLGVFDGRPGNGYSPYTGYITVANSDTWQQYELSRTALMDTDEAEFILSVKSTIAPDHLVIDDVVITGGGVTVTTPIYDIQYTTDPGGASPLVGQTVNTGGIVTATLSNGFFMQNGGGPWSGIFVFSTQNTPEPGDSVAFTANVEEFFGMTQLTQANDFVVVNSDNTLVVTDVSTAQVNTEEYEGVLVKVSSATCTDPNAGFGQFVLNDGSGECLVDDVIHQYAASLGAVYNVTGPVQYAFDEYKILPRDANDVEVVTGIAEQAFDGVKLFPNPATDVLSIHLHRMEGRTEYALADATGRVVLADVLRMEQGTIGLTGLAPGSYVLTLHNGDTIWSSRVLVAR